jgi:hypothetical protein
MVNTNVMAKVVTAILLNFDKFHGELGPVIPSIEPSIERSQIDRRRTPVEVRDDRFPCCS